MKTLCDTCVWANTLKQGQLSIKEAISWCACDAFAERTGYLNFPEISECKYYENETKYKAKKRAHEL